MVDEQKTVKYAQERLEEWAAWMRELPGVSVGYKHCSAGFSPQSGSTALLDSESNERALEVERIVSKLKQLRPSLYIAVEKWYVNRLSVLICAKSCNCSERVFRDRLRLAEMFVAGRLLG